MRRELGRRLGLVRRRVAVGMHDVAGVQLPGGLVEAVLGRRGAEQLRELRLHRAELDAVLRPLRAGKARRHRAEVEAHHLGEVDLAGLRHAEHALRPEVAFEGGDLLLGAAGAAEIVDGLLVDREEAHRRAVLGRHVADRRAVGDGQARRALAEELDELADHLLAAQDLGDGEHQVGGGDAFLELAGHLEADHVGRQEVHRLAEHAGLGLDAADAPADDADAVDHRRVAVGADQRVGVVGAVGRLVHAARQVFEIHLVDDAEARRHDAEGVERAHAPFHELVALAVALELELHVEVERLLGAEVVDHHRVVDDQVDRHQRLDRLRILVHRRGDAAHRSQVGEQRHAGEVLQHHPRDDERDLVRAVRRRMPVGDLLDMLGRHQAAVAVAQHALEHDADRDRQPVDVRIRLRQLGQRIEAATPAAGQRKGLRGGGEGMR